MPDFRNVFNYCKSNLIECEKKKYIYIYAALYVDMWNWYGDRSQTYAWNCIYISQLRTWRWCENFEVRADKFNV